MEVHLLQGQRKVQATSELKLDIKIDHLAPYGFSCERYVSL